MMIGGFMTEEEWQDELRRRDEIIDSYEGLKLDSLFEDARLSAIKCVLDKSITGDEACKLVRALVYA